MKKTLTLISVLILYLTMCTMTACSRFDPEKELSIKVNSDVSLYCLANYADVKGVYAEVTYHNVTEGELYDTYDVKGVVTINDQYNEKYKGKFTAVYYLTNEEFVKKSLDITTPTKEN